jgi:hypothetical protein
VDQHYVLRVLRQQNGMKVKGICHFCYLGHCVLLNYDLSRHFGMNTAVVPIGAVFGKRVRVLVVGVETFGFEGPVVAGDYVRHVIFVDPRDCGVHRNGEGFRGKRKIVDLHFRRRNTWTLALRPCRIQNDRCNQKQNGDSESAKTIPVHSEYSP